MADHTDLLNEYNYTDLIQVVAQGQSGGIVLLWRANELMVNPIVVTSQELHAYVQVNQSQPRFISLINASNSYFKWQILWKKLEIHNSHNRAWLLCEDFNEISSSSEKFGGTNTN